LLPGFSLSQTVKVPHLALQNVKFSVDARELPDSVKTIKVIFENEEYIKAVSLNVHNGAIDTSIILSRTGNFSVKYEGVNLPAAEIRIIPGILSILPPLLAIVLALLLRQVIISLLIGILVGAVFVFDYNIGAAFLRVVDTYIINAVSDRSHIQIIVFTLLFGGMIGLISKSGGVQGIANAITKVAKTRRSALLSTWLSGIIIFFDDYSNALIVGNLMKPVTDRLRISREKLSFIVDATSAPVASIFLISSWIGFEVSLIQDGLNSIGSTANAYNIFIQTIPFRFYPIMMLIFVFVSSYFLRDFGAMRIAERRAIKENKLNRDGATVASDFEDAYGILGNKEKARWYNGIIPITVLIVVTIVGLVFTGVSSLQDNGISDYSLRNIIGSSDPYSALLWSSFLACLVAGIMIVSQKIMNVTEAVDAWFVGLKAMLLAVVILTLAWGIGSVTQDMKTADYIVGLLSDSINPRFLPVLVFLVCALTSFSTGTSFGTMAVMMPIVIPLSSGVCGIHHFSPADQSLILVGVISSVLAGSVFGDHCSPISDTTILSSMASGCDHIEHVRTQLPYAVVVAIFCMLIGDIPTAFGFSPYLSILIIAAILTGILFFIGKKTEPDTFNNERVLK
jgi:Na+/H+ antiporter NhaC